LTQSQQNANDGVGMLQVADGSLSQITTLLNRAVTLATESATGTIANSQRGALDAEFSSIKAEIDNIGNNTTFNNTSVFSANTTSIFLSDSATSSSITIAVGTISSLALNLSADDLVTATDAQTALTDINNAISQVASMRGMVGATVNRLQAATSVMSNQVQNLTSAEDSITAADIAQDVADMSKYNILLQTGMAALGQANSTQQQILTLLK
jgi:flagellin